MSANTTIEWATKSWNPVRGCSRVSSGCDECYAMKFAHRFSGPGKPYEGLTTIRKGKVDWSGVARFIPSELDAPLRWKKSERVFVNSMSDLFHHSLSNLEIAAVFAVMAAAPRHQFLVLTKRPERAAEFFTWLDDEATDEDSSYVGHDYALIGNYAHADDGFDGRWDRMLNAIRDAHDTYEKQMPWPLPNVWLGTSVENQETAEERIPILLKCPAAIRWISAEPLLGPVELWKLRDGSWFDCEGADFYNALKGTAFWTNGDHGLSGGPRLDWVVVGGESGPGARAFDIAWARSLVEQCGAASVPVFVKQLGSKSFEWNDVQPTGEFRTDPQTGHRQIGVIARRLRDRKGGDVSEWPEDLRVREFPEVRA